MKKLIAVIVAIGLSVCAMADEPDMYSPLNDRFVEVCTLYGVDSARVMSKAARNIMEVNIALNSDDHEQQIATLYAIYKEWQIVGEVAEKLFTIQK